MRRLLIEEDHSGQTLRCPACEGDYMHHAGVAVYARRKEDSGGTRVNVAGDGSVEFAPDESLAGNPSPRRNGLTITFWCELCKARPTLAVWQHKGATMVGWLE